MPVTSTKKRLSATVYYLLIGLALAWPGLFATGWLLPEWRTELTLTPLSLGTCKRIVLPMLDAFVANACIVVGHAWVVICIAFGQSELVYPAAYLFWFGGLMPLMMAYMQKIVPFLWFEYRFSKRPERKTAPLIDEMVSKYASQTGVVLYYLGVLAGLVDLTLGSTTSDWTIIQLASAVCLTLGSALLFVALRRVLFIGGPRPKDDTPGIDKK